MASQTQMPIYMGMTPGLNDQGQIENLAARLKVVAKTAAYTVKDYESGTVFTNTGASGSVTFTLPTIATALAGVFYWFFTVAGQNIVVASDPTDKLVVDNNATADTLTSSTSGHVIGAGLLVICDGTQWLTFQGGGSQVWVVADS